MDWLSTILEKIRSLHSYSKTSYRFLALICTAVKLYHSKNQQLLTQPLYNFPTFKTTSPPRLFLNKADLIHQEMKAWGQGGRILDIDCNLGFFSLYFADRGYQVTGMDKHDSNISICRLLQHINRKKTQFFSEEFSSSFLTKLKNDQYDIAFLFDAIHPLLNHSLETAQELIASLLEKVPIMFIELTMSNGETFPEDEQAVFSKCRDITIKKIGLLQNHETGEWRPLYLVKKNKLHLCGQTREISSYKFTSHFGAGYYGRTYYDCGDTFIKKYQLPQRNNSENLILQEIKNYQSLPKNDFFPAMLSLHQQKNSIELLFNKLPGENVHNLLANGQQLPILPILIDLIRGIHFLFQHNLYHNDIRLWNMLHNGGKTYLFDLGLASQQETENTNTALLWIISQLHRFNQHKFKHPLSLRPDLNPNQFPPLLRDIIIYLQKAASLKEFLDYFVTLNVKNLELST